MAGAKSNPRDDSADREMLITRVFDAPRAAAIRDRMVKEFGAIEGANQTMDRLAAHLTTMA